MAIERFEFRIYRKILGVHGDRQERPEEHGSPEHPAAPVARSVSRNSYFSLAISKRAASSRIASSMGIATSWRSNST